MRRGREEREAPSRTAGFIQVEGGLSCVCMCVCVSECVAISL